MFGNISDVIMNIGIFKYLFGVKEITEDAIRELEADEKAKRICFSRIQTHALWKTSEGEDMVTVPFGESIGTLLKDRTGVALRKSSKGNYYQKLSEEQKEKVAAFINENADVVFLRDLLDVSVALSLNFEDDRETHTPIGELEKNAKYDGDEAAVEKLAAMVDDFINSNVTYKAADCVCAVPPTNPGEENLPNKIVSMLKDYKGLNISDSLSWTSKYESLKNADGADKLEMVKQSGFLIADGTDIEGKNIILLDDLYKSGTTLQYIAMKLKEAGANKVYGLCIVKSLGNK